MLPSNGTKMPCTVCSCLCPSKWVCACCSLCTCCTVFAGSPSTTSIETTWPPRSSASFAFPSSVTSLIYICSPVMADSEQPHSQARPWLGGLELQDVRDLLLPRRLLLWIRNYLPNMPLVSHSADNEIRLNISMMIRFQQPQRFQNQET